MVSKPPSKFNISDELFFKIFPVFSLITFGLMIFFSITYRLKKVVSIDNKTEEVIKVEEFEKVEPKNNKESKKVHPIEKENRRIFGDRHIDNLKSKYVEFKNKKKKF